MYVKENEESHKIDNFNNVAPKTDTQFVSNESKNITSNESTKLSVFFFFYFYTSM